MGAPRYESLILTINSITLLMSRGGLHICCQLLVCMTQMVLQSVRAAVCT